MSEHGRPNVLLITTDQQRFDTLGFLGNSLIRTPHLDALAERGFIFRHGYIQNPVCVPSRTCLATGRYTSQHGVEYMESAVSNTPCLPPWERTIAERLQERGYRTAAFGKIHVLPPRGFDVMALTMGKGGRWTVSSGSPLGPAQLGPVYADWLEQKRPGGYEEVYAQRRSAWYEPEFSAFTNVLRADEYVDRWIGDNAVSFLEREHDRPFFTWCGFCSPHFPYDPPEPYASMYDPRDMPIPEQLHARQENTPGEGTASRFDQPDGEDRIQSLTAAYWGMVSFIDDQVGRISEILTRQGLWDNTMVIFTTDHGEMLGDFGMMGKGTFVEQVIRVPYIVVPPARYGGGGQWVDGLVEHIDLAPTILDYAGLAVPPELPGTSLRSILEDPGEHRGTKNAVLCQYTSNDRSRRSVCLRTERYKYIVHTGDLPAEFYDLDADPNELVNVIGDTRYADVIRSHAEALVQRLTDNVVSAWNTTDAHDYRPGIDHFGRAPGAASG